MEVCVLDFLRATAYML